jgi:hypothetical protein
MRYWLAIIAALILLLLLNACAVMDINSMETAVPLKPGKAELSIYEGHGLDISSAVVIDESSNSSFASHDVNKDAYTSLLSGVKANIGIVPKLEFSGRAYFSRLWNIEFLEYSNTQTTKGYKAGLKVLCKSNKYLYLSLLPSVNIVNGKSRERSSQQPDIYGSYNSYGLELQVLGSFVPIKQITFTGVCKFNRDYYSEVYNGVSYGTYAINHMGIRANLKLLLWVPFIIVDVGNEFVPVVNGNNTNLTSFAIGIGMRI